MTISSSTRKAGPFAGDDASTVFAFSFKVFSASDLYVVKAVAATGAETVLTLTTDYTVSLNADQNNSPGGTVTLTSVLASGYTLTLTSSVGYLQPTDLTNQGGFYPQVITTALDRLTILAQQLKERLDRAAVVPISSTLTMDALTADLITLADDVANIDTVAGISADVSTVAGISTDVTTAAANITGISNFADIYYGPSATAPTTRKDGSALQEGDLYFDTATNLMRVRSASSWLDAQTSVPISITTQTFSGTGSQVDFTLSSAPPFLNAVEAAVSGVLLVPGVDYTLSGTTLTLTSAPASGTGNVFVRWYSAYSGGVPNDGSVTAAKLSDGSVTAAKLSDGSVTAAKLSDGSVTAAKLSAGMVVQEIEGSPYLTYASTTATIPNDNTIPQQTEGVQVVTVSLTPSSASSRLVVEAACDCLQASTSLTVTLALFKDTDSNALACAANTLNSSQHLAPSIRHEMAAGSTAAMTFKLRVGVNIGTLYINGNSTSRLYGGISAVRIRVREVKA